MCYPENVLCYIVDLEAEYSKLFDVEEDDDDDDIPSVPVTKIVDQ